MNPAAWSTTTSSARYSESAMGLDRIAAPDGADVARG
jgi:hypothetical protein